MKHRFCIIITVIMLVLLCSCRHIDKNTAPHYYSEMLEVSEISQISEISEISEMPVSSTVPPSPPQIQYRDDGKTVHSITGQWSEQIVRNEKEALQSLEPIKDMLRITDLSKELVLTSTYSVMDKMLYIFDKVFHDTVVYGSEIILSVNYENLTPNYLESYLIDDEILQNTDFSADFSPEDIQSAYHVPSVQTNIFAYGDYASNPIIVYIAHINGVPTVISSHTGEIIILKED